MIVKVEIAAELHDKLKLKSAKTGISQLELVNRYVSEGLRFDEKREVESPKPMTPEEIDALLEHDWPEGDWISKRLAGLIDSPVETDAVELKKASYKRGFSWFF